MLECKLNSRDVTRSILLGITLLILVGSLWSAEAAVYYSLMKEPSTAVTPPPVELQEGTAGDSTIYTNGTSAKVSVELGGGTDVEDYVDNNASNVDSSTDKGTHSNFTAQKYGPDMTNDTLTEGNTTLNYEYLWISGDDDSVRKLDKSDPGGTEILSWDTGTSQPFGCEFRIENGNKYIYIVDPSAQADALIKFHADNGTEVTRWDISGYSGDAWGLAWNGSRWFVADKQDDLIYQVDPANATFAERSFSYTGIGIAAGLAWDGSYLWVVDFEDDYVFQMDAYGNIQTSWSSAPNLTQPTGIAYDTTSGHLWIVSRQTNNLHEYYINGTGINDWDPSGTTPEGVAYASGDIWSYQLDLEVQWTNVDYDEENEELCIYGGTMSAENLTVDVWYNSTWQNLFANLSSGWNNASVSSYLDSSNFTIRLKGGTETSDTTQTSWNIDATLLHVWTETDVKDYVDNNTTDVDNTADKGTHGNFTAQQYGPDLVNDTLAEENTNDKVNYVDETSDVDSSADKGTHSSFVAQQAGPDLINDTLTEGNTGTTDTLWLYVNADDESKTDWMRVGANPYLNATDYPTNFANASGNGLLAGDFSFADSGKSAEGIVTVEVQLYVDQSATNTKLEVYVWDGSSWTSLGLLTISTSWGWINWTATTVLDTWTKIDAAKIYMVTKSGQGLYEVDCARPKADYFVTDNFELDLEVRWTDLDFGKPNEELCIYGGSMGAEDITVDVWNGTGWENLFTNLNSGWNNISVSSYLTSDTFVIRFKGGNETGDTNQDTWNIDVSLIHVWNVTANYELDLEVQWTNVTYTYTNEELSIYTGTTDAEDIRVDVWNGSVWINVLADLTANSWNNISVTSYLNSSTFTIRFKGGNETGDTNQDTWNTDAVLLHVWTDAASMDFNYVLKFLEKDNSNWKVRLRAYDNSSLSRLDNCSIYIYNGSNSTQIVILSGDYENQTGPWIDLNASDTEYIWMHVETSSAGTSYVYTYLEIRVPNTTTYAQYIITFEIT